MVVVHRTVMNFPSRHSFLETSISTDRLLITMAASAIIPTSIDIGGVHCGDQKCSFIYYLFPKYCPQDTWLGKQYKHDSDMGNK